MKPGEVYRSYRGHDEDYIIYVVVKDYGKLRPVVLYSSYNNSTIPSTNMAIHVCPNSYGNDVNIDDTFYDGDEKIFDSIEDYIVDRVADRVLLGDNDDD